MRHILSNYARERKAKKRGDGVPIAPVDEMMAPPEKPHDGLFEKEADMLAELEQALQRMERVDRRGCEVVECRF